MLNNPDLTSELGIEEICEDRKAYFRSARTNKRSDIDSNKLVPDFPATEKFNSTIFQKFSDINERPMSNTSDSRSLPIYVDPRIEKLKEEWKYCPCMQKQYDHNKCCIYTGFFRLKLQKILHGIPFHVIVSLLVIVDVLIVLLELTIDTRQLAMCSTEEDCVNQCNYTNMPTEMHKNETEHLVCGFKGLTHQCIPESEATPNVSRILSIMTITILSIFIVEILVKFFAFGFRLFKKCFEVFDALVILISFMIDIVHFFFEENEYIILFELLIILRLWRVVRIITASIAAYNAVKEEKDKKHTDSKFTEEANIYFSLMKEYEFAKCEIIRMREVLVAMKVNPFPHEYGLTKSEASYVGVNLQTS